MRFRYLVCILLPILIKILPVLAGQVFMPDPGRARQALERLASSKQAAQEVVLPAVQHPENLRKQLTGPVLKAYATADWGFASDMGQPEVAKALTDKYHLEPLRTFALRSPRQTAYFYWQLDGDRLWLISLQPAKKKG